MPDPNMSVEEFEGLMRRHLGNKPWRFAARLKEILDRRFFPYNAFLNWLMKKLGPARDWPASVCSDRLMDAFEEECLKCMEAQARNRMVMDIDYVETEMRIYDDWRTVLEDHKLAISPLFRYAMAIEVGLMDIATAYKDRAAMQAICCPCIWTVYGDLAKNIPADQKEAI